MPPPLPPAIRYHPATRTLHLHCLIKPGVSAPRAGIASITAHSITVSVAARARDGEANRAVRDVIAAVLRVARTDVEIARGLRGREKRVVVRWDEDGEGGVVERVEALLRAGLGR
jgi:uncharacterized protein YggU (UPF0235/DUF167 family)